MIGEVHPGIYRLRLPVPGALRSMNSYLLQGKQGWSVIDPGPNFPGCSEEWEVAIDDLGIQFSDIKQILVTHGHIDHVGLAGWLQEQSGAEVLMNRDEYNSTFYPEETEKIGSLFYYNGMASLGINAAEIEQITNIMGYVTAVMEPWPQVRFLQDDSLVMGDRTWEVILTTGHTNAHVCLFNREEGLLLSGDQILPTISTVIRFPIGVEDNPLRQYLDSLTILKELNPTKIMPAHGEPFNDMDARIEQLLHHHQERLQQIMDCLSDEPCTVRTIVDQLFGRLDAFNLFLASGEISAHLLLLQSQGKLQISQDSQSVLLGFALV